MLIGLACLRWRRRGDETPVDLVKDISFPFPVGLLSLFGLVGLAFRLP
jgi:hypothetical protein